MGVQGLVSILQFFLLLLLVVLVILAVMSLGGLLVTFVSLPALLVLPTVRRQFVALTETLFDVRPDSFVNWRFVGAYLLFVYTYGFTLLLVPPILADYLATYGWLIPDGRLGSALAVTIVALLGGGLLLLVRPAVTRVRLRAVGEWTIFLCLLTVLTVAAAVAVPYLLFDAIGPLVW